MRRLLFPSLIALTLPFTQVHGSQPSLPQADHVQIKKAARKLLLIRDGQVYETFSISLGGHPTGPKLCEGDERTPEGRYTIDARNAGSGFHRSLHISYPSPDDVARSRRAGCAPGGAIMIHGIKNGLGWLGRLHRAMDWTDGCVAVTDREMDEIWGSVRVGTPVEILP